ncbi:MAG: hypothetical protein WCR55_03385 [Lentisphaerota bacterium]
MKYAIPKLETMSDIFSAVCGSGSGAGGRIRAEDTDLPVCQNGVGGSHNGEGCIGGSADIGTGWDAYCNQGGTEVAEGCSAGPFNQGTNKCSAGIGVLPG